MENAIKKRRGGRQSNTMPVPLWLDRATALFNTMEGAKSAPKHSYPVPAPAMKLRERKPEGGTSRKSTPMEGSPDRHEPPPVVKTEANEGTIPKQDQKTALAKKLPRVILKVGPPPTK